MALRLRWLWLVVAGPISGCYIHDPEPHRGNCWTVGSYLDESQLVDLYDRERVPLFLTNGVAYRCRCLNPTIDSVTLRRLYGGDDEIRRFAEGSEYRQYGGQVEDRFFDVTGEERLYAGDLQARLYGAARDERAFGGDDESRRFGADDEARGFGGDGEGFYCTTGDLCPTYQVSGRGPLQVFDGRSITDVPNRCAVAFVPMPLSSGFEVARDRPRSLTVTPLPPLPPASDDSVRDSGADTMVPAQPPAVDESSPATTPDSPATAPGSKSRACADNKRTTIESRNLHVTGEGPVSQTDKGST